MISHEHKCIFVHIPRTSGTSVELAFGINSDAQRNKHLSSKEIYKSIGEGGWTKYFKFSFVRNPWDRIISLYHQPAYKNINKLSSASLKSFLKKYSPKPHEHGYTFGDYLNHGELDFIGRFENRSNDLMYISDKIDFVVDNTIWSRRTVTRGHYTEYYDDETRQIVAKRFKKDIEHFGYKFGD